MPATVTLSSPTPKGCQAQGSCSHTEAAQENPAWPHEPGSGGSSADTADKNRVFQGKFLLILKKMLRGGQQKHHHMQTLVTSSQVYVVCTHVSSWYLGMGGFAGLSPVYMTKTQKERGWTYTGALNTAQRMKPHLLGRSPQPLPTAYLRPFTSITKPRQGYLGAHISLAFVCLPS